jgi:hypothetical protein
MILITWFDARIDTHRQATREDWDSAVILVDKLWATDGVTDVHATATH